MAVSALRYGVHAALRVSTVAEDLNPSGTCRHPSSPSHFLVRPFSLLWLRFFDPVVWRFSNPAEKNTGRWREGKIRSSLCTSANSTHTHTHTHITWMTHLPASLSPHLHFLCHDPTLCFFFFYVPSDFPVLQFPAISFSGYLQQNRVCYE